MSRFGLIIMMACVAVALSVIGLAHNLLPDRKPYTNKEIIQIYETGFIKGYLAARNMSINNAAVFAMPTPDSVLLVIDHTKADSVRVADSIETVKTIFKR